MNIGVHGLFLFGGGGVMFLGPSGLSALSWLEPKPARCLGSNVGALDIRTGVRCSAISITTQNKGTLKERIVSLVFSRLLYFGIAP